MEGISKFLRYSFTIPALLDTIIDEGSLPDHKQHLGVYQRALKKQQQQHLGVYQPVLKSDKKQQQQHFEVYQRALESGLRISLKYLKLLLCGPPRSGKTSLRQRLVGEIINLMEKATQPSTGAAESHNVVIKPNEEKMSHTTAVISDSTWSSMRNISSKQSQDDITALDEELHLLFQFITEKSIEIRNSQRDVQEAKEEVSKSTDAMGRGDVAGQDSSALNLSKQEDIASSERSGKLAGSSASPAKDKEVSRLELEEIEAALIAFEKAVESTAGREKLKVLLEKTILLNMVDTGGQPAFMEMLPALTVGPALYLLFLRLDQELNKRYQIQYVSDENDEVFLGESSYTIQEVILQVLSSIACSRSDTSLASIRRQIMPMQSQAVMLVGSYKDQVKGSPEEVQTRIMEIDSAIQDNLKDYMETNLLQPGRDLLRYATEDQLLFDVDNMSGDIEEIKKIQKRLEQVILQEIEELPIPASWLMFSIFLRRMGKRVLSLSVCEEIAHQLHVTDVHEALWFLHHCVGIVMYYPDVEELKDIVICDPQIVFDTVTELILNTFQLKRIRKAACDKFKQTGQFSFKDIQNISRQLEKTELSLPQIISLLESLNIIAPISSPEKLNELLQSDTPSNSSVTASKDDAVYFMPAVLSSAQEHELDVAHNSDDPVPLLIRFKYGIVPIGVFCYMIASLVSQKDKLRWILQEPNRKQKKGHVLRKDRITFKVEEHDGSYNVTFISKPKRYEIHITLISTSTPLHEICCHVLETVCDSLDSVISKLKHRLTFLPEHSEESPYELGFSCPKHLDTDHMIVNRPFRGRDSSNSTLVLWFCYMYSQNRAGMFCLEEQSFIDLKSPNVEFDSQMYFCWYGSPISEPIDSSQTRTKKYSAISGALRGVDDCAETTVTVTNSSQYFNWKGYGLTLHIPDGCLPADVDQCVINIKASLAGQYEFPEGSHLVSAVYWLRCGYSDS